MSNSPQFYNRLLNIPIAMSVFFFVIMFSSSHVAQNRMRAFAGVVGLGITILGIRVCDEKTTASLGLAKKTNECRPKTGKMAQALGVFLVLLGLALFVWSVTFWKTMFI